MSPVQAVQSSLWVLSCGVDCWEAIELFAPRSLAPCIGASFQSPSMGLALPDYDAQTCLSPVRVCGFATAHSDTSPHDCHHSPSFSDGHSPSHLKVPASPLSAALRGAQRRAVITRPPGGLKGLNIGKSRTFNVGMRKSCSSGQLQSLAEEREMQSLGLRSGSCVFGLDSTSPSPSPSHSNPISIPTPRAQCSGRVASSHSLDLDEDPGAGSQHDGLVRQSHTRSWQSEPQDHSQAAAQSQDQPQPPSLSTGTSSTEAPESLERAPTPAGVLPDEPGAVFLLESVSLPQPGSARTCSDSCTRSQSAAVLSACG